MLTGSDAVWGIRAYSALTVTLVDHTKLWPTSKVLADYEYADFSYWQRLLTTLSERCKKCRVSDNAGWPKRRELNIRCTSSFKSSSKRQTACPYLFLPRTRRSFKPNINFVLDIALQRKVVLLYSCNLFQAVHATSHAEWAMYRWRMNFSCRVLLQEFFKGICVEDVEDGLEFETKRLWFVVR